MSLDLSPSAKRKAGSFAVSLLFSISLWLLFYLSRDVSSTVRVEVQLVNRTIKGTQRTIGRYEIRLRLHGRGWLLSRFAKTSQNEPLRIEGEFNRVTNVPIKPYLAQFSQQIPSGIRIDEILTDSIHIRTLAEISKKVPLRIGFQVSFQKQFYFSNPARIYPDSLVITGPKALLKSIEEWSMPNIQWVGLNHSVDTVVSLYKVGEPAIKTHPLDAKIQLHVDRYTEDLISLPIKVLGNLKGNTLTLIPSRVMVTCLVPLGYYNSVREDLFEALVDLKEWNKNRADSRLKISITRSPDFIRIVKINPATADFLVYP